MKAKLTSWPHLAEYLLIEECVLQLLTQQAILHSFLNVLLLMMLLPNWLRKDMLAFNSKVNRKQCRSNKRLNFIGKLLLKTNSLRLLLRNPIWHHLQDLISSSNLLLMRWKMNIARVSEMLENRFTLILSDTLKAISSLDNLQWDNMKVSRLVHMPLLKGHHIKE